MSEKEKKEEKEVIELFNVRSEKAFSKNEITRTNYFKIKEAKTRQETIDELHGFIQEELSNLEAVPEEIKKLLKEFKLSSSIGGGKRTRAHLETQQLRILQEAMRHVWRVKEFEPSNVDESVLVKAVDDSVEGYAKAPKDFDLEAMVKKAILERKKDETSDSEKKKD